MSEQQNKRVTALRAYFIEVTRDLLTRGIIKRKNGESLDSLLRSEFLAVSKTLGEDLQTIGTELGMSVANFIVDKVKRQFFG